MRKVGVGLSCNLQKKQVLQQQQRHCQDIFGAVMLTEKVVVIALLLTHPSFKLKID